MTEHRRPTDRVGLAELAEGIAAGFEPEIRARGAALAIAADPAPAPVPGDADRPARVVQDLLDDALRHGGAGVRLTAEAARPGEGRPARPGVVFAVADDGPGVAREHPPRPTQRSHRVDEGRSRASADTGSGPAIVGHIGDRHRGRLWIESAPGAGTTVRIRPPAARYRREAQAGSVQRCRAGETIRQHPCVTWCPLQPVRDRTCRTGGAVVNGTAEHKPDAATYGFV